MFRRHAICLLTAVAVCLVSTGFAHGELRVSLDTLAGRGDGGLTLETAGNLTAESGRVDIHLGAYEDWREDKEASRLFVLANDKEQLIGITITRGMLSAAVAGGSGRVEYLRYRSSRGWSPEDLHHVQLSWAGDGEQTEYYLRVDGRFVGYTTGAALSDFPGECQIAPGRVDIPDTPEDEAHSFAGTLDSVLLAPVTEKPQELMEGSRTIRIDGDRSVGKTYNFWSVGNFTEAYRLIDDDIRDRGSWVFPFVDELNIVYIMGGRWEGENEWYLGQNADGSIKTDFTGLIAQLKGCIRAGYKPRIVLDNIPPQMSTEPNKHAYGNTAPPADEKVWREYVKQAVGAMIDAFGRDVVAGWYFRVGTEPDLRPAHWSGTKEQYFAHYDYTVDAMDEVLPEAKIGPGNILNPAHGSSSAWARNKWGLDIIDHCATGVNAATGKIGTRIDHFSCSWYGRVGSSIDNFDDAITVMRERLDKYPQFAAVPIEVGEHAVLGDEFGRRLWAGDTTEWGGSFFAALADRTYHHDVKKVFEWDHATMGVFHPKGHVLTMLEEMVDSERLLVEVDGESAARCSAIAVRKGESVYVLLYNHRQWRRPRVSETVDLVISDVRMKEGASWDVFERWVDSLSGVYTYEFEKDCEAAGISPLSRAGLFEGSPWKRFGDVGAELFAKNINRYRRLAKMPELARDVEVSEGKLSLRYEMEGHSVRLIRITPGG